jgi:NADH:ubiquinone oxidoreductase subunit 5 (subunit L)/multisubunit Na+/H+ antiporter MnhA subunit
MAGGNDPEVYQLVTLYSTTGFTFAISFYFDQVTAVFSITGALIFFIVARFSVFYMHRDEGFRRFFSTILLFATGYNLIVFSGNLETLFMGWEIIGLSSFLLIAFYRNRYLPVKNAFKVLSIYRVSDIALLVAMWLLHHVMHRNISFTELGTAGTGGMTMAVAFLLLLGAAAKSAQMPFSSWLPRAMEGPTSSSAVFYGSLSVHIGVFLLLRTYPLWEGMPAVKAVVIATGAITALSASCSLRSPSDGMFLH